MENSALIREICRAAIDSVMPEVFIPASVQLNGNLLSIQGKSFDLNAFVHIYAVSVGKAAVGMASALSGILGDFITEGIILTKHLPESNNFDEHWQLLEGGHPIPDAGSVQGAKAIFRMLDKADEHDLVIFLISGGGSALMSAPIDGIDLETLRDFSNTILGCGASINEFNTLRKHLDLAKGGRLAQRAAPAEQITLVLSDVVGSPPDIIASGPTVPDSGTWRDALEILDHYAATTNFPPIIRETLEKGCAGTFPETLKANESIFRKTHYFLLAENRTAAYAAAEKGRDLGLKALVLNTKVTGEASAVGALLPSFFSEADEKSLLIFGGETTVHLHGDGLGGRNLELALAAVRPMAAYPGCTLITLATDGEDGTTDAAGAVVTADTLAKALEKGSDPDESLRNNDSYHFFETVGGLLRPGSSGTNVNDLIFLIRD